MLKDIKGRTCAKGHKGDIWSRLVFSVSLNFNLVVSHPSFPHCGSVLVLLNLPPPPLLY